MTTLQTRLADVVGGKTAKALENAFGLRTVDELLRHYPRRMVQRGELTALNELKVDEDVTVLARVISSELKGYRKQSGYGGGKSARLEVIVGDGRQSVAGGGNGGRLQLVFFGSKSSWRQKELAPGTLALFAGKVSVFNNRRQLSHPDYTVIQGDEHGAELAADVFANALIPVYPANKHVRSWVIANSVQQVLLLLDPLPDPLPVEVRARHGLMSFDLAIRGIHSPSDRQQWFAARRRLKWDEAFAVQLVLAQRRVQALELPAVVRPFRTDGLVAAFEARLPFTFTGGQKEVGQVLAVELASAAPMHRLLQGEVGSGKTVVALRAMLQVVDAGGQAALLAPTEVLAAQHARTIESLLGPLAQAGRLGGVDLPGGVAGTRVALLTGSMSTKRRREALLDAASGAAGIVVGTHALIQEQVAFADLGLVVVDEQHRFGVEQRDALRGKAHKPPHLLVMTATPIPRTVAMTVFGDLETSTLTELPVGRSPISTTVVPVLERPTWLGRVWERITEEVRAGRQSYVVCPRIGDEASDEDAELEAADLCRPDASAQRPTAAVVQMLATLTEGPLRELRVAALHGRLHPDEKDRTMTEFTAGRIDVLVCTTVIEVGVDVPNATVMAVLNAERFGVSQLHQLRGRIGRGSAPGVCLLVTDQPADSESRVRLDAVAATTDGFELAHLDVEMRREGDILGTSQSGRHSQLTLLSLLRDEDLIVSARAEATDLIAADPTMARLPMLAEQIAAFFGDERAEYLDKT